MWPSSWKMYLDFVGSSLETELELFEVYDIGDDGDDNLSHHYLPRREGNLRKIQKNSSFSLWDRRYVAIYEFCAGVK